MTDDTLATRVDTGIEYSEFEEIKRDTVTILRAEHERLLWLTTPKPIKTALRDEWVLVCGDNGWIEALFNPHFNEFMTHDEFSVHKPTHWLPLPNTPMPITAKHTEDADDALER